MVPGRLQEDQEEGGSSSNAGGKYSSGWISLMNALTGSGGASPVPFGAYVVVAEPGCAVTEGGCLDSKIKGKLIPGSCLEVVATRMEEGVVRGLLASGGHVTLFAPPRSQRGGEGDGRRNSSGQMFAMPVPLGTYKIVQGNGVPVTTGADAASSVLATLGQNSTAKVVETRVQDGRVRGRVGAAANEDGSPVAAGGSVGCGGGGGWISLFAPDQRWATIVSLQDGRPLKWRSGHDSAVGGAPR